MVRNSIVLVVKQEEIKKVTINTLENEELKEINGK